MEKKGWACFSPNLFFVRRLYLLVVLFALGGRKMGGYASWELEETTKGSRYDFVPV
jgi:hypothetical protein